MFQKGTSGNPAGRKPGTGYLGVPSLANVPQSMNGFFEPHVATAVATVIECLGKKYKPEIRLQAATIMFDRLWGKPKQITDIRSDHPFALGINIISADEYARNAISGESERAAICMDATTGTTNGSTTSGTHS